MIIQSKIGLNSRSEVNPYLDNGFLPLITAPMYSVVDESNYQFFLDNKIQVCLPRKCKTDTIIYTSYPLWLTYSLEDFNDTFLREESIACFTHKVCIDTANGNMPQLHEAIRKAKEIHGGNLVIMAGNVGSVEAFIELAKTGVDYIRVGIGGGGGCNTTSNTGVGQKRLDSLIFDCKIWQTQTVNPVFKLYNDYYKEITAKEWLSISRVKIVADGISSYINYCQKEYGFNDNGYAAINTLLNTGADLVMVGKLFAQCVESAGEKACVTPSERNLTSNVSVLKLYKENRNPDSYISVEVKYSGMSTLQEQKKYKKWIPKNGERVEIKVFSNWSEGTYIGLDADQKHHMVREDKEAGFNLYKSTLIRQINNEYKPSEGSVQWIPVRWTLNEWLNGSDKQDEPPYLMGFINSLKSMMSYTGKTKL